MYKSAYFYFILFYPVFIEGENYCNNTYDRNINYPRRNFNYNYNYYNYNINKVISNCKYTALKNPHFFDLTPEYVEIKGELKSSIEKIIYTNIYASEIKDIEEVTFTGVTNIKSITIENSQVAAIKYYAFKNFVNLEELLLPYNNLTELKNGSLSKLKRLKRLVLTNNNINKIDQDVFQDLTNLKTLELQFNHISILNNSLHKLKNLTMINLENNNIIKLESYSFNNMDFLIQILLSQNNISSIESEAFTQLARLELIDLSHNQIDFINSNSFYSVNLIETLKLNNNKIQNITFHENLPWLKTLDLNANSIKEIGVLNFVNLNSLLLSNNKIQALRPGCFAYMKRLTELDLSRNLIPSINTGTFSGLQSLQSLNLSRNYINSVKGVPFHNTKQLIWLDISENQLKNFDPTDLANILHLYVQNNNFTCANLYKLFNIMDEKIVKGSSFEGVNVKGIVCQDHEVTGKEESSLERYLEHGFQNSTFVKYFEKKIQSDSENQIGYVEMMQIFQNLTNATLENNEREKVGFESVINYMSVKEEQDEKQILKLDMIVQLLNNTKLEEIVELLNNTERNYEILGSLKQQVTPEGSRQENNIQIELMKLNTDLLYTLTILTSFIIIILGIFTSVYIYFQCMNQTRKTGRYFRESQSMNEMNPII